MGVPKELAFAPKKATQFSSGSSKILTAAIIGHSGIEDNLSSKKADKVAQHIFNHIAYKLGYPVKEISDRNMKIDLEPTYSFAKRVGINLQQ
jgi:hypothetical protein